MLDSFLYFVAVTTVTILIYLCHSESSSNSGNGTTFLELVFWRTSDNFLVAALGLGRFLTGVDEDAREFACS